MARVTLTQRIEDLERRVAALESEKHIRDVLYTFAREDGYRDGRESVLGPQPAPPQPRHLRRVT